MKNLSNKISMVVCMLLISNLSLAQLSGGIGLGVGTGAVEIEEVDRGFNDVVEGKNIMGYEAGLFLKYQMGSFYVKPMALYSFQSGDITYQGEQFSYKSDKLGVPLIFGLDLVGPLAIEAGPVYNYVVDMTEQVNSNDFVTARSGIGYRAGIALNFKSISLNAAYEGMTYQTSNSEKTSFTEPYKIIFGIGLTLGGDSGK